jgi:hypothetical protein
MGFVKFPELTRNIRISLYQLLSQAPNKGLGGLCISFFVVAVQKCDSNVFLVKSALKVVNDCRSMFNQLGWSSMEAVVNTAYAITVLPAPADSLSVETQDR